LTTLENRTPRTFLEEVEDATPGDSRLFMCIQCGSCGGSCPSGADMTHSPRQLFALIRADMREEVLNSNTPWYCVSCYYCTVRCPQEIHITDLMYTLKSMAIAADYREEKAASDLAQSFVEHVENYGRSFEFGLATRHYLRHQPFTLLRKASIGMSMFSKGRIDLTPHKIDNVDQLRAILTRAKELEEPA
jgi:heterodisulfide reductase subunit C